MIMIGMCGNLQVTRYRYDPTSLSKGNVKKAWRVGNA